MTSMRSYPESETQTPRRRNYQLKCRSRLAGVSSNTVFSLLLCRRELCNSFNLLLVCLAVFDTVYLGMAVLESFRKVFHLSSPLQMVLFPYVQYPLQGIALTGSIFMTVAISFERYVAVHNPINYNRAMNDTQVSQRSLDAWLGL